jgi:hypothetical protein
MDEDKDTPIQFTNEFNVKEVVAVAVVGALVGGLAHLAHHFFVGNAMADVNEHILDHYHPES